MQEVSQHFFFTGLVFSLASSLHVGSGVELSRYTEGNGHCHRKGILWGIAYVSQAMGRC